MSDSVSSENIYALCDVDETQLNKAAKQYPKAKLYRDFREMLDKEQKNLHGVTITIPDFMHATASLWAMERGIGVHCQKPLTADGLGGPAADQGREEVQGGHPDGQPGILLGGDAHRLRVSSGTTRSGTSPRCIRGTAAASPAASRQWPPAEPVPATLDWNLWQGRSQEHTYSSKIHPINWRGFLDYGTR